MKKVPLFEIRLNDDVLVLRGDPEESPAVQLSGIIVLSIPEAISVKSLTIKVAAVQTISATQTPFGPTYKYNKKETVLWSDRKIPIGEKTVLPAGNHEFDFNWILSGGEFTPPKQASPPK
ncbi:hypothetical protein ABW21_db0202714 [Orbilia brochopaga]|nr:hypothetical protein ABW21_db0202714 [Drechslerella brochopaga]